MVNFFIERQKRTTKYYSEDLGNGIKLDMVLIPEGEFIMGAPESEEFSRDSERLQHKVTVPTFFMGRYPVTQQQWQAIMGENPSRFGGDKLPVERVSWNKAKEFCNALSEKTSRTYRLPSEAEWEYACRAGTTTPYHFGETITKDLANYRSDKTTPVGNFPANEFGLHDMHGNVWEWCEDDWHKNYKDAPIDGSAWVDGESNYKVLRGGSWLIIPNDCRSASRDNDNPENVSITFGFRVVCEVPRTQ